MTKRKKQANESAFWESAQGERTAQPRPPGEVAALADGEGKKGAGEGKGKFARVPSHPHAQKTLSEGEPLEKTAVDGGGVFRSLAVEGENGRRQCKSARVPSHPLARELSQRASLGKKAGRFSGVAFFGAYPKFNVNAQRERVSLGKEGWRFSEGASESVCLVPVFRTRFPGLFAVAAADVGAWFRSSCFSPGSRLSVPGFRLSVPGSRLSVPGAMPA